VKNHSFNFSVSDLLWSSGEGTLLNWYYTIYKVTRYFRPLSSKFNFVGNLWVQNVWFHAKWCDLQYPSTAIPDTRTPAARHQQETFCAMT